MEREGELGGKIITHAEERVNRYGKKKRERGWEELVFEEIWEIMR